MDIQKYIESGIIEEYCMGLLDAGEQAFLIQMAMLYPEVKDALTTTKLAMEKFARFMAVEPDPNLKDKILSELNFADRRGMPDWQKLPPIDKGADRLAWLNILNSFIPGEPDEDFVCQVLRKDDSLQQMLVVSKTDIPEEVHGDYIESFLILKGECECTVDNSRIKLSPGDFLEISLHVKHDIKVLSPYVAAVLQYRFL